MSGVYAEGRHEGMHLGQLLPTEVEHYHNYLCVHCKANTLQIHDGHSSQNSKLTNADLADFNAYPSLNPSKATMSNAVTDEIAAAGTQSTRELSVSFDGSSHSIKINNPEQGWVAACTNQQLQNIPQQNQKQYRDDLPLIRNPVSTDHQKRSYRRPVLYQPRVEWQTPTIREPTHSYLEPFPEYIEYSRPKLLTLENNSLPGRIGDTYTNTGRLFQPPKTSTKPADDIASRVYSPGPSPARSQEFRRRKRSLMKAFVKEHLYISSRRDTFKAVSYADTASLLT